MRDIKIYLHTNTTLLQSLVHLLAATGFFLKASHLPLPAPSYFLWLYFYYSFGVLLAVCVLFQAVNKFAFRHPAAMLNILAGVVLMVESLVKMTQETMNFYLLNFSGGLLFTLMGIFEDRIRKIPYLAFNTNQVFGRRWLFSTFIFPWNEIADVKFRHNRVKITTQKGQKIRFRVARQSTGGIMYKSAEYFSREQLQAKASAG